VRLTLRTLLAYLDDMLDPAETKLIGQKVAESEAAQELIARIKQVTRRRRLTTPPATGPNSFEPNTVADYLDNTLPPEQVEEVEKACLESDVHLAEVAAAHQILTLVLGQPALVPPTARQRMYALVHGHRVSRPRPLAAAATPNGAAAGTDARAEEDETLLLGLPAVGRQAVMLWLLPLAAILLLGVLAVAIWQAVPFGDRGTQVAANNDDNNNPPPQPQPPESTGKGAAPANSGKPDTPSNSDQGQKPGGSSGEKPAQPAEPIKTLTRPGPPSKERREVGRYHLVAPSILVNPDRSAPSEPWKRLKSEEKVFTTDTLVSLPGYHSDLGLDSGVALQLWGSTYELNNPRVPILESGVVLHVPDQGIDADFTLDRGAVKLVHKKQDGSPANVRLRFLGEVWDVQLKDAGGEVGVVLFSRHVQPYGTGLPPEAHLHLFVLKGRVNVRVTPFREFDNVQSQSGAPAYVLSWDNVGPGAQPPAPAQDPESRAFLALFSKPRGGLPDDLQKLMDDTNIALEAVSKRLSGPGRIETGLVEMIQPAEITPLNGLNAVLAVRGLGALDAVRDLINILEDGDKPALLRQEAMFTLRHWTGRNDSQEARLYDPKTGSGELTKGNKYSKGEAETIMSLLHTLSNEQLRTPDTWAYLIDNLKHDKLAIRELSYYHLRRWVPEWQKIPYNPADPAERRETAYAEWKRLIPDGKLPPRPQRP
jgi:hypothetical protein